MLRYLKYKARPSLWPLLGVAGLLLSSCAQGDAPGIRPFDIPSPTMADEREQAINEKPDSVLYLPLGSDVLVPERITGQKLPDVIVGPFELRSETVAGALQLITSDYEIPMAFESEEGLTRTITVTNLKGRMNQVVDRICGLADLYCSFEDGVLTIKDTQTFTVSVPPIGGDDDIIDSLAEGISAITGSTPIVEIGTRTLIYDATNRTAKLAERYFQRLRSSTALVVFQVYIWEVSLNFSNATGIDWDQISSFGKFGTGISISGGAPTIDGAAPISIGLPTTGNVSLTDNDVLEFISQYGAVKTISQPQVTMLSGSGATLRVADTRNYVSSISRTIDNGESTTSTEVDSVDTGFTLTMASKWNNSTIYSDIDINLEEFQEFENFTFDENTSLRLPRTTERELQTQVRIRPGDSLLIAGLVRESDDFDKSGPGISDILLPTARSVQTRNSELVFLLKPRVIAYTDDTDLLKAQYAKKDMRRPDALDRNKLNPAVGNVLEPVVFPIKELPLDLLNPAE